MSKTYHFDFKYQGREFTGERIVTGTKTRHQEIYVIGFGMKIDPVAYGDGDNEFPVDAMEFNARKIAEEIILGI